MGTDRNYTGYATIGDDGKLEAASSYESVGMYQLCVYVKNGIATCLRFGGLPNADGMPTNKKVDVLVQEQK